MTSAESLSIPQPAAGPRGSVDGLRLDPFRALRYSPDRIVDLAAVTSPPYDVIGDAVARWESTHPYNVVRLILPREEGNSDSRYRHAARDLVDWLDQGVLLREDRPALYVYEQSDQSGLLSRGLIGAVSLHHPQDRIVLPHEEVFPRPVADRAALMQATGAQLEPIMLVYDGNGPASDVVDDLAGGDPWLQAVDEDEVVHRLWRLTDPRLLREVARDLRPRQALIADGHHRYAAYLQLCERSGPASPWSSGLALLVDSTRHPLRLSAIHRSVAGLPLADATRRIRGGFGRIDPVAATDPMDTLAAAGRDGFAVLLTNGRDWLLVRDPDPAQATVAVDDGHSDIFRRLDASIVHSLLLRDLLMVDDSDARVSYHHDAAAAVRQARGSGSTAVLLNPAPLADVLAVAAGGERMPRKSTSFGPKPRTGLVLRLVDPG